MSLRYIDIHSHLNFSQFDEDREEIIAEMKEKGIGTICVGTDAKTSAESVELAAKHENIYATIGIHPTHFEEQETRNDLPVGKAGGQEDTLFDTAYYESLLGPKVVAVGECGLDYYRTRTDAPARQQGGDETQTKAHKDQQRQLFIQQIEFAQKHQLPLMLHCRASKGTQDAYEEALDILAQYPGVKGNFHFFAGNTTVAKRAIDAGFSVSFDGPVTFVDEYDEVIKSIPADMIMVETDAPFAAPVPHRGKRNSPLFVTHIADHIAGLRGVGSDEFRVQTIENTRRIFGI